MQAVPLAQNGHQTTDEKLAENQNGSVENHPEGKNNAKATQEEDELKVHPQPWCGHHVAAPDSGTNVYNYGTLDQKEKSPMCKIAELARCNRLRHVYTLLDESGPAHKKTFTVKLQLSPTESYCGSGSSIKKAQQTAAELALERTSLKGPQEKSQKKKRGDGKTPPQLLHHVCRSLDLADPTFHTSLIANYVPPPMYQTSTYFPCSQPPPVQSVYIPPPPSIVLDPRDFVGVTSKDPRISSYSSPFPPIPSVPSNFGQNLYHATVNVSGEPFATGVGVSVSAAKANAASRALLALGPTMKDRADLTKLMIRNYNGGAEFDEASLPKYKQKSVISEIHERALQLKMDVKFEVVVEDGPPHDRSFEVICSLLHENEDVAMKSKGSGRTKKEAKQNACSHLLSSLRGIDHSPIYMASSLFKSQKKLSSLPKEPKRKTIDKDKKMDPDYGHQINPVSRLIQVLQSKEEAFPVFEFIGEHGQCRYREFAMRVTCGEMVCEGRGPNKRLAKRAAAEAMLERIGYVKPLPAPGKSLLKKKSIDIERKDSEAEDSISSELKFKDSVDEPEISDSPADSGTQSYRTDDDSSFINAIINAEESELWNADAASPESSRRRVTFSNQVESCPPPGDTNYPQAEISPLKMEVLVEGKIRRMRRSKENSRSLTSDEKKELVAMAVKSVEELDKEKLAASKTKLIGEMNGEKRKTAKEHLDAIATTFKFNLNYIGLPNVQEFFVLLTVGLDEVLVCHGQGKTMELAEEMAAYNALRKNAGYEEDAKDGKTSPLLK